MSNLKVGDVIWYRPRRDEFAQTTGSKVASDKGRPCVIVALENKEPIIAPVTSAKRVDGILRKNDRVSPSACIIGRSLDKESSDIDYQTGMASCELRKGHRGPRGYRVQYTEESSQNQSPQRA